MAGDSSKPRTPGEVVALAVGSEVAGAEVTGASVAGASVTGAEVTGASVAGASVGPAVGPARSKPQTNEVVVNCQEKRGNDERIGGRYLGLGQRWAPRWE